LNMFETYLGKLLCMRVKPVAYSRLSLRVSLAALLTTENVSHSNKYAIEC
jgi:hypothetical protein